MKTTIKKTLQGLLLVPMLALGVSAVVPAMQADVAVAQTSAIQSGVDATGNKTNNDRTLGDIIKQVTNVLLYIVGAVSVIMIIYGGFRYITSGGDSNGVTAAKNTILYSVIGLMIAVLSYAIVNFVIGDGTGNFLNFSS